MIAHLRKSLTGRYRMLEREAAKTALDLNLANTEFQNLSTQVAEREKEHAALQETCYRNDAELTEARQRLADLQLEQERTRGRLDSQAKQIGAIEERLTQGESEAQELEKRQAQFQQELEAHLQSLAELEAQTESARERLAAKTRRARAAAAGFAGSRQDARDRTSKRAAAAGRSVGAQESAGADRRVSVRHRSRLGALPARRTDRQRGSEAAGRGEGGSVAKDGRAADGAGIHRRPQARAWKRS